MSAPEVDLHAGPEGWVLDAIAQQEAHIARQKDKIGVATIGETPECNGRCHVGDYPDVDRDCPAHGGEREVCPDGCGLVDVEETSIETSGYEEQQRDYHVTRLSCGHEIAVAVKR